jgi:hypothetical protein
MQWCLLLVFKMEVRVLYLTPAQSAAKGGSDLMKPYAVPSSSEIKSDMGSHELSRCNSLICKYLFFCKVISVPLIYDG